MVGTLKKGLQKLTSSESKEWEISTENVLYGYRCRPGIDGMAPSEIPIGVKLRFAIESTDTAPGEDVSANARPFELALALTNGAERLVPCTLQKESRYLASDMVLLRPSKQPEGHKVQPRICFWPVREVSVQ